MMKKGIILVSKFLILWGVFFATVYGIYSFVAKEDVAEKSYILFETGELVVVETDSREVKSALMKGFEPASGSVFLLEDSEIYSDENCSVVEQELPAKTGFQKIGVKSDIFQVAYNDNSYFIPTSKCTDSLMDFSWSFSLEGEISNESILVMDAYLQEIPQFIRDSFVENEWKVLIDSDDINKKYHNSQVDYEIAGLTSYSRQRIFFGNYGESLKTAVIHEFGHYYDFTLVSDNNTKFSDSEEFQKIFNEEAGNLGFIDEILSDHARERSSEYFAESFQQYFLNPELLEKNCPSTYQLFNQLISSEILTID